MSQSRKQGESSTPETDSDEKAPLTEDYIPLQYTHDLIFAANATAYTRIGITTMCMKL